MCYLCEALTHEVGDEGAWSAHLFTNWGEGSAYRETRLAILELMLRVKRLTEVDEFLATNGQTPFTRIQGFSHWRALP